MTRKAQKMVSIDDKLRNLLLFQLVSPRQAKNQNIDKYQKQDMARDLGVSPDFLSKFFNGRKPSNTNFIKKACERYGFDANDILMVEKNNSYPLNSLPPTVSALSFTTE